MVKRLTKHGNSLALVIDRPILDLLKIDTDTLLDLSTTGTGSSSRPPSSPKDARSSRRRSAPRTSDTAKHSRNLLSDRMHGAAIAGAG